MTVLTRYPEPQSISWALARVPRGAIVGKHSLSHLFHENADRTLCGQRIPWLRVHASSEGNCGRCRAIAGRQP